MPLRCPPQRFDFEEFVSKSVRLSRVYRTVHSYTFSIRGYLTIVRPPANALEARLPRYLHCRPWRYSRTRIEVCGSKSLQLIDKRIRHSLIASNKGPRRSPLRFFVARPCSVGHDRLLCLGTCLRAKHVCGDDEQPYRLGVHTRA
jgi:hypothetical protein